MALIACKLPLCLDIFSDLVLYNFGCEGVSQMINEIHTRGLNSGVLNSTGLGCTRSFN